jgi:hypothetical protein
MSASPSGSGTLQDLGLGQSLQWSPPGPSLKLCEVQLSDVFIAVWQWYITGLEASTIPLAVAAEPKP